MTNIGKCAQSMHTIFLHSHSPLSQ